MRRAIARGRMFPQNFSTDRRYGRLSLKAIGLFPLMWANADDQGRLCGDPEEIKYAVCPNIDHITKRDIPDLLKELQDNKLILCYDTPKSAAIQMLDWWDANHKMQWAWQSEYPPPEGWKDHLRYKKSAQEIAMLNWPISGERSGETLNPSQVSSKNASGEDSGETLNPSQVSSKNASGEDSGETTEISPLTTPSPLKQKRKRKRKRRGNSPEALNGSQVSDKNPSGENPHPRHLVLTEQDKGIYETLKENYCMRWGTVRAKDPDEIIPRQLKAKDEAQLRDLAIELSGAGGCPADKIKQAFDETAGKHSVSYVRAVLLDWLGIERVHST